MKKFYRYSVLPFSHPSYDKNAGKVPVSDPGCEAWMSCGICGLPTKVSVETWGVVINGGADWGDENSPEDGGHMGVFPIGPGCHRRYRLPPKVAVAVKAVK